MKGKERQPVIDKVLYTFREEARLHIDIVPIARLLTERNKGRTTAPHRTSFYRIIWFREGQPTHSVDFEKIPIHAPALLFIHKDKIHQFDRLSPHDGMVLIFTDDFFCRTENDRQFLRTARLFSEPDTAVLLAVDEHLNGMLEQLVHEIRQPNHPVKSNLLYHLLNTFLYSAERVASAQYSQRTSLTNGVLLVSSFLDLVEQQFQRRLTIETYADWLNVTVNTLNEAALAVKGKTSKQLVTERLLLEAKRLLVHSALTVKEIGFELGFDIPTNFNKFFLNNAGQTPLAFQKANK